MSVDARGRQFGALTVVELRTGDSMIQPTRSRRMPRAMTARWGPGRRANRAGAAADPLPAAASCPWPVRALLATHDARSSKWGVGPATSPPQRAWRIAPSVRSSVGSGVTRSVTSSQPPVYCWDHHRAGQRGPDPAPHVSCGHAKQQRRMTNRRERRTQRRTGPRLTGPTRRRTRVGPRLLVLMAVIGLILLAVASQGAMVPVAPAPSVIL